MYINWVWMPSSSEWMGINRGRFIDNQLEKSTLMILCFSSEWTKCEDFYRNRSKEGLS
jgi:hypothetical protein